MDKIELLTCTDDLKNCPEDLEIYLEELREEIENFCNVHKNCSIDNLYNISTSLAVWSAQIDMQYAKKCCEEGSTEEVLESSEPIVYPKTRKVGTKTLLKGSLDISNIFSSLSYKREFNREHPDYFEPEGLLVFSGGQGTGKTLSAVQYVIKLCECYPRAILCSNVDIVGLPKYTEVIEYDGIDSLTSISNGEYGVIYFIDEIHLEFNSLESKNIDIDVMIEISQQRKQRKHIVGTTQVYGRMAKPLREQIKNVVVCKNYFNLVQFNWLIDGDKTTEKDGKLQIEKTKLYVWFHSPSLYGCYDTYAKMRRYNKEWKGRKRVDNYV